MRRLISNARIADPARRRIMRTALGCLALCAAFAPANLTAQSTMGAILGTVKDSSGAVVFSAKLTLKDLDENTAVTAASSPEGLFEFLNLRPGRYELTVEKLNFASVKTGEIHLGARETRRADFTLQVAPLAEVATVTAQVSAINTDDGTISESIDSDLITRLPTNYRALTTNPMALVLTIPGVQSDGVGDPGTPGGLSIGGGTRAQIESSVDGISTVDVRFHSVGVITPSAETISEFRVTSSGGNAALGQMGDVTITTKSGTN